MEEMNVGLDARNLFGWTCPNCKRGVSPFTSVCPCLVTNTPYYPTPYIPNPYITPGYWGPMCGNVS